LWFKFWKSTRYYWREVESNFEIRRMHSWLSCLSKSHAVMAGLLMVAYTLVSVVISHDVFPIESLVIRLSSFLLAGMLCLEWDVDDNVNGPLFALTQPIYPVLRWLMTILPAHRLFIPAMCNVW
jgi:hypothetical protein